MATTTFNPYLTIGEQLKVGLDEISSKLNPNSTVDDLVNEIYKYIQALYYPATSGADVSVQLQIEIKSVIYNIINAYNNQGLKGFNSEQMVIVGMYLGPTTTAITPIDSIGTWFADIENNIPETGLTVDEQMPLLLGSVVAKTIYEYWIAIVAKPGKWAPFFQKETAINYANIPTWVVACIEGTFIGASSSDRGLIAPTTDIVSTEIVSSLIGALVIGSGKVIFKWLPKIQPNQLDMVTLNGVVIGGFSHAMQSLEPSLAVAAANNCGNGLCPIINNCGSGNCKRGCGDI